ncbi:stage III sporulation protein AE [Anaerosalibacter sp. Marseille-P3206]|uniref:stage III sporulation protein AE n=1 Tax=Anaerosalibacter sp. Marseille-P3206 TaxID=1871005 RepID=UPI0009863E81|nr:stage III sporulation protein AE [Anaerosalibacter sp. Marseille-P3206]
MKEKIGLIIIILLFVLPVEVYGDSSTEDRDNYDFIIEQYDMLNIDEIENAILNIDTTEKNFPKFSIKEYILASLRGENIIDSKAIFKGIGKIFLREVYENVPILIQIFSITIICAILTNIQTSFESTTVSQLAYYISYLLIITLVIKSFNTVMELSKYTIDSMVKFMELILPTLLTLLVAVGGLNSSTFFHPMVLGSVNIIGILIKDLILPMIFFSFIIGIISRVSERIQFSKLAGLIRQVIVTLLGGFLTIFIGIMSIYGVVSTVDGVTARTAKFAVDRFIPIVGKFLSDAMDTVVGCSLILKNAVGGLGLFALLFICIAPIIKIVALIFMYKLIIAVTQPISSLRVCESLEEVNKSLLLVLASLLSVSMLLFITITIIVQAGNVTMMLR